MTPGNGEAYVALHDVGPKTHDNEHTDSACDDLSRQAAQRAAVEIADKAFASLRARLALAGFTVHLTDDGAGGCAYLVSRWAQYRTFADRDALAAFAHNVGAAS